MPLRLGNSNNPAQIYVGSAAVSSIRYGLTQVWPTVVVGDPAISATIDSVTDMSAQVTVTASPTGATAYLFVSQNSTPPTEAVIISGTGADWHSSIAVTATPSGFAGPSGLTTSTTYYLHAIVDNGGDRSGIFTINFTTASLDTTAPVLNNGSFTVIDATSADINITSDENDGVLYVIVTTTQGFPSATQIRDGEDSGGANAVFTNNGQGVAEVGVQLVAASSLAESPHYAYCLQDDASGNAST